MSRFMHREDGTGSLPWQADVTMSGNVNDPLTEWSSGHQVRLG